MKRKWTDLNWWLLALLTVSAAVWVCVAVRLIQAVK